MAWEEAYLRIKWHLDPSSRLATTDMGRQLGEGCAPFWREAGSPSNTMWPGPRPTCVLSFVLIHPTVWPQCANVTDRQRQTARQRTDSILRANRFRNGCPKMNYNTPMASRPSSPLSHNIRGAICGCPRLNFSSVFLVFYTVRRCFCDAIPLVLHRFLSMDTPTSLKVLLLYCSSVPEYYSTFSHDS